MRRVTEIHLAPDEISHGDPVGQEHTTRWCWCAPIETVIVLGLFRAERVVFHRDVPYDCGEGDDE